MGPTPVCFCKHVHASNNSIALYPHHRLPFLCRMAIFTWTVTALFAPSIIWPPTKYRIRILSPWTVEFLHMFGTVPKMEAICTTPLPYDSFRNRECYLLQSIILVSRRESCLTRRLRKLEEAPCRIISSSGTT
jgi:hypothetical protein